MNNEVYKLRCHYCNQSICEMDKKEKVIKSASYKNYIYCICKGKITGHSFINFGTDFKLNGFIIHYNKDLLIRLYSIDEGIIFIKHKLNLDDLTSFNLNDFSIKKLETYLMLL